MTVHRCVRHLDRHLDSLVAARFLCQQAEVLFTVPLDFARRSAPGQEARWQAAQLVLLSPQCLQQFIGKGDLRRL